MKFHLFNIIIFLKINLIYFLIIFGMSLTMYVDKNIGKKTNIIHFVTNWLLFHWNGQKLDILCVK